MDLLSPSICVFSWRAVDIKTRLRKEVNSESSSVSYSAWRYRLQKLLGHVTQIMQIRRSFNYVVAVTTVYCDTPFSCAIVLRSLWNECGWILAHWIGGWVGPKASLDVVEERKFLNIPGLELWPLGRPARSQSLYRLSYRVVFILIAVRISGLRLYQAASVIFGSEREIVWKSTRFRMLSSKISCLWCVHIVTYQGFVWQIRRGLDLMIEFIGPLYNCLQQFTNHTLSSSSDWALHWNYSELHYSVVLPQFKSPALFCITYNSLARTPRKTPSSVVKNVC
jgi:hypothetical protein